jgi:hypothetical protein
MRITLDIEEEDIERILRLSRLKGAGEPSGSSAPHPTTALLQPDWPNP